MSQKITLIGATVGECTTTISVCGEEEEEEEEVHVERCRNKTKSSGYRHTRSRKSGEQRMAYKAAPCVMSKGVRIYDAVRYTKESVSRIKCFTVT